MFSTRSWKGGFLRRWGALFFVVVLAALLAIVDQRLKQSRDPSFIPASSTCYVAANDFPTFWRLTLNTNAGRSLLTEVPRAFSPIELRLRTTAGVRPTPVRWRIWMGDRLVAGKAPEGVGMCVRPGLLLRLVDPVHRLLVRAPDEAGINRYSEYYYGWRDGFLVASTSRAYVAAALNDAALEVTTALERDEMTLHWTGAPAGEVHFRAVNDLPIEGWLDSAEPFRDRPLTLTDAWPEQPMISLSCGQWEDAHRLLSAAWRPFQQFEPLERIGSVGSAMVQRWGLGPLDRTWDSGVEQFHLAILDMDLEDPVPVPRVACVMRGGRMAPRLAHPLLALTQGMDTVPYDWGSREDVLAPVLGEKVTLCLARAENDWYAASRADAMSSLVGRLEDHAPTPASAALRLNWMKVGRFASGIVERMSEWELVPRLSRDDVLRLYAPFARACGTFGMLRIDATWENGRLHFQGVLTAGAGAP